MVIEGDILQSDPLEADITQGSRGSPILFPIHTPGLIDWVEGKFQAEGLCFVDDPGWLETGKEVNQVVQKLEACAAQSIEGACRRDLQFDTAKTEASIFTLRKGHKKHLRPKPRAKI